MFVLVTALVHLNHVRFHTKVKLNILLSDSLGTHNTALRPRTDLLGASRKDFSRHNFGTAHCYGGPLWVTFDGAFLLSFPTLPCNLK